MRKKSRARVTRSFGKTKLYTLNIKNPVTRKILELEKALIAQAVEKEGIEN